MAENNGWSEWKNLVLVSIEDLKKDHNTFGRELTSIKLSLNELKTKERMISALIGALTGSAISSVVFFLLQNQIK